MVKHLLKTLFLYLLFITNALAAQEHFKENAEQGLVFFNKENFEKSVFYYQKAISVYTAKDDSLALGECYLHLGTMYCKTGNYPLSLKYTDLASGIFKRLNDPARHLKSLINQGNTLSLMSKNREALPVFEKGLELSISTHNTGSELSLLNNIGSIHFGEGNYAQAISYYTRVLNKSCTTGNKDIQALALINLGISHHALKQDTKALAYMLKGIDSLKQANDMYTLHIASEQLALIYAALGKHELAYDALSTYILLKDSINSAEMNNRIVELEKKYSNQRLELENLSLRSEKQHLKILYLESDKQRRTLLYLIVSVVIILVIIGIAVLLVFRLYRKKLALSLALQDKNRELEETLALNKKLEDALRQDLHNYKQLAYSKQMNPHFIFNALNSVQDYILSNDKLQANYYLGELATLIRRILENSEKEYISLKEELTICEIYMRLEQKRFEEKFNYSINIQPGLDLNTLRIPPMLLQPFLENAIWHGLMHKDGPAMLELSIACNSAGKISISIRDNGVGRKEKLPRQATSSKQFSMGISLTEKRIQVHNLINADEISLQIIDLGEDKTLSTGTEVILQISKKENESAA